MSDMSQQPSSVDQPVPGGQGGVPQSAGVEQPGQGAVNNQPAQQNQAVQNQAAQNQQAQQSAPGGASGTIGQDPNAQAIGQGAPGQTNPGQIKDPEDWATGDQPMTDSQRSYLDSLAKQAGETLPANLTKAQASEHIDRLQALTGRGQNQA